MESFKNIYLPQPIVLLFALVAVVLFDKRRKSTLLISSLYLNGPPGFIRTVPLYIQARSIRI